MSIIAMIPARLGSKRVPKKNLRLLAGMPLIDYSITAAKKANIFDRIYVNSESDIFKDIAMKNDVEFYKRPPELASDESVNDDFLFDFVKSVEADHIVQLLPTSPLITANEIERFAKKLLSGSCETLISVVEHKIACVYMGQDINFSRNSKHISSQKMEPVSSYATVLMGWDKNSYLKNMSEIGCGYHGGNSKIEYFPLEGFSTIDIDEEIDFKMAEFAISFLREREMDSDPKYYEV